MPRAIWQGAISFGLVHIPVGLYSASTEGGIDFDWLDKRSMDPVGYKRVNKRTGREIDKGDIVRGVKLESGDYVVLTDEEIRAAFPKSTRTIAIESFVHAADIPQAQFEKPYYLEPAAKSERAYALLREAMLRAGVVGLARVVIHTKEHLAALIATGPALMLNTLRWASELRSGDRIDLPAKGRKSLKDSELKMAGDLIATMTETDRPAALEDQFSHAIHALVARRARAGRTEAVKPMEEAALPLSNVVDLTRLLKQSLGARASPAKPTSRRAAKKARAPGKPSVRRSAAR